MPRRKKEKVAQFIDVKNFIKPFKNDEAVILGKTRGILNLAASHGEVVLRRAYADFTHGDVPDWVARAFTAWGIQCIFTPCFSGGEKDIDDQMMAVEIATLPSLQPEISTICVVTGDGHIVPALAAYRATGRKAIVISSNGTNSVLKHYANDGFYQIDADTALDSDATDTLPARIEELVQAKDYGKDGLVEVLMSESEGRTVAEIEKQIALCIAEGALFYEQAAYNGKPIRLLRWKS